jgi:SAM-dependent methyltransferase
MQVDDVHMLQCVDCEGNVKLEKSTVENEIVINGILKCTSCSRSYPVIDEVGVFFRKGEFKDYVTNWEIERINSLGFSEVLADIDVASNIAEKEQIAVSENWEYQHEKVYRWEQDIGKDTFHGKRLFWTFIPVDPDSLKNKVVFVACVGRGKEAYHALQEGPKKVIANEIGAEIHSITGILGKKRKDLILLRHDISYPPVKKGRADITICDHALQHVYDHKLAFSSLAAVLKKDGIISICVYSYENNFLMTHIVEPSKSFLRYFPLWFIRCLAFLPAFIIYLAIHLIYVPASKISQKLTKLLPLREHMIFWSTSPLKFIWSACFDLMHAPISYHFKKENLTDLAQTNGIKILKLINTHGTTWSLVGMK